jgi:hypothetical protein
MTRRLALVSLLALAVAGCGGKHTAAPSVTTKLPAKPSAFALPTSPVRFGNYTPVPLLGRDAPAYAGPATPHSLANVRIVPGVKRALTNPGVAAALARNGFVVVPSSMRLFQYAYEGNVYAGYPVFVTTDAAFHAWHLAYDKTLRTVEQKVLLPKLDELVSGSLAAARAQASELAHTKLADAASRTVELFEVAAAELRQPVELAVAAEKEKTLIDAHSAASAISPILGVRVDYSLFTPRGHYTRNAELRRYFTAMSVLGQLPFCLPGTTDCPGSGPVLVGLLASRILERHSALLARWRAIYDPTAFLVGRADDYTPLELAAAATKADPGWLRDPAPLAEAATLTKAVDALVAARPVTINPERAAVRFMGTRFTVDAYVLDQLVAPNVGTSSRPRLTPSGLDVAAALGSQTAYRTLKQEGATAYAHYDSQLAKVRKAVDARPAKGWGSTVYDAWLYALQPLFTAHGRAFPDFMRSPLWAAKDQQAGLGSYTELKHDTTLYAKQYFAEGGDRIPKAPRNWVEPDPVAFERLAAAADLLGQGLRTRGLLTPQVGQLIADERGLFAFLGGIARDELAAKPISVRDNNRLRFMGSELEALWIRASDLSPRGMASPQQTDALVADLGSSPKGVLEVATGRVDRLYVLVPNDSGNFEVAVGGVYSYYEFTEPPGTRLDDQSWQALLDHHAAPARPAWEKPILTGKTDRLGYGGP